MDVLDAREKASKPTYCLPASSVSREALKELREKECINLDASQSVDTAVSKRSGTSIRSKGAGGPRRGSAKADQHFAQNRSMHCASSGGTQEGPKDHVFEDKCHHSAAGCL